MVHIPIDIQKKRNESCITRRRGYLYAKKILRLQARRKAVGNKVVIVKQRESRWLDIMESQLDELPETAEACWEVMKKELDLNKFIPAEYGLE